MSSRSSKPRVYLALLLVVCLTLVATAVMAVAAYLLVSAPSSSPVTTSLSDPLSLHARSVISSWDQVLNVVFL